MNPQLPQLAVAVIAMVFLGLITLLAVAGSIFHDAPPELTFTLVGAMTGVTGQASAYLFRINGTKPPGG